MSVQADCYATLKRINTKLYNRGKVGLAIRTGYRKYWLYGGITYGDVSPSLTLRQLLFWLEAFESGLDYATSEREVLL